MASEAWPSSPAVGAGPANLDGHAPAGLAMTGQGGISILTGTASGPVVAMDEGLSFWGGVDAATGMVIDVHHPRHGASLAGAVVLMPTSRGSCSGSGVLLELAMAGRAPVALI